MNKFLKSSAWIAAAHGVIFLILGFNLLTTNPTSLQAPLTLFSFLIMGLGAVIIIFGIARKKHSDNWWLVSLMGLIDLIIGIYIFFNAEFTSDLFIKIIAVFAFATGLSLAYVAYLSQKFKVLLFINAGVSGGFGIILFFNPIMGSLDLLPLIGLYTLIMGLFLFNAAWWMHRRKIAELKMEENADI
jgi:uncharacterized membrane protein HdeD (DUF308 family)